MTAQLHLTTVPVELTVDAALAHVSEQALQTSGIGRVGLELEAHLVDLAAPAVRPTWQRVQRVLATLPALPGNSSVTVEPGGQVELSTTPQPDAVSAVSVLARDRSALSVHLREHGLGAAILGADPARRPERINPGPRYTAMEQHFAALGRGRAARAMMTSTAALQVNLDAGPEAGWASRWARIQCLQPVLVAASAASPWLGGVQGWQSMRRHAWHGLDPRRTAPLPAGAPGEAWARYALAAPVMLVRDQAGARPVTCRVSFTDWLHGHPGIDRPPSTDDLDYHLTTLFPPVRPRGYLELRAMDAVPDRWWPALVALAVTLVDDPVASDAAADLVSPVRGLDAHAAREGCADPELRRAVVGCLDVVSRRCPADLRAPVDELAELVSAGTSISDLLRRRIEAVGPVRVLEEEAGA